jgi:protocatechuate 3,4-dioxygenase beta subunit
MLAMTAPISDPARGLTADRRSFLRLGGIAALGLTAAACSSTSSSTSSASSPASPASSPASSAPSSAAATSTAPAATDAVAAETTVVDTAADSAQPTSGPSAQSALTEADFEGLGTCSLMPDKTAGPFPLDQQFDRRDVTEGVPGQPMRLGLRVVDKTCAAVPGAAVEIWHADATGDYSAFIDNGGGKDAGAGTTFLRGTQTADDNGIVEFLTVYPGWYSGRAVHIHLRVHLADTTVLTSQMFFDADYTAGVYAAAPYTEFGLPDTPNSADRIAGDPQAEGTLLHTTAGETSLGAGTLGLLNLGIDTAA